MGNILILGGDGYLGWPTAMSMAARGDTVTVVDNYLRRTMAEATDSEALIPVPSLKDRARIFEAKTGFAVRVIIGDLVDPAIMDRAIIESSPDTVIHYAEQPSAPYSMMSDTAARLTFNNNLNVTLNLILSLHKNAPDCHIVKLGTMGEYGTPNIDIEEGWIDIEHNGRSDRLLFPRAAGSLYHTTKVLDTDLLWFYCRAYGIKVTDLMQGPVYGLSTPETVLDDALLPHFHYDDIFGTLVNRFVTQAVIGMPLTVYGKGGQTRGYLNLLDTLQCIKLATDTPVESGELRILNQFTETFSVNDLAERVERVGNELGLGVTVKSIDNPRKEPEEHYYNPAHSGLTDLGLEPHFLTDERLAEIIEQVRRYSERINPEQILPRVRWS